MRPRNCLGNRKYFRPLSLSACLAGLLLIGGVRAASVGDKPQAAHSSPSYAAIFADGAKSTGWINFNLIDGKSILVPAKVNGKNVQIRLIDGADTSYIDKGFATSIGILPSSGDKAAVKANVQIQLGNLTLPHVQASIVALEAKRGDPSFSPFILSDDLFNAVVVDMDFARHSIAFEDPNTPITPPPGATRISMTRLLDSRTVPVSIEGGKPVPFEWFLGDPAPVTVYQPYYEENKLLQNRATSIRLGGGLNGQRPQEAVATLSRVQFAGVDFVQVPGVFPSNAVRGSDSPLISGNIGLALLDRFHLVIDYTHNFLYAAPESGAAGPPFVKDRLGLYLSKQGADIVVDFVAPGSPAQAAGFKAGERIASINQKSSPAWTPTALSNLSFTDKGTDTAFRMADGRSRHVKSADYF